MLKRLLLMPLVLLLGATLGAGVGLYLGWQVWPVSYHNTDVSALRQDYQDEYVIMVATSYSWDGDLARAQAYLQQLNRPALDSVAATRERLQARGAPDADLQRLNRLLADLRGQPPAGGTATP